MANVRKMYDLFEIIDSLIERQAEGDEERRRLLKGFCFRLFSVLDGLEEPNEDWKGVALVAREDLPEGAEEINDEFLHDAWSNRSP